MATLDDSIVDEDKRVLFDNRGVFDIAIVIVNADGGMVNGASIGNRSLRNNLCSKTKAVRVWRQEQNELCTNF